MARRLAFTDPGELSAAKFLDCSGRDGAERASTKVLQEAL